MTCDALRQGDEMFCSTCKLRWGAAGHGDPIECPRSSPEPTDRDLRRQRFAKAINGPHHDRHIGREMMLKLRDHKWTQASKAERQTHLNEAEAILKEIDHEH